MAITYATFRHGNPLMVDYTPVGAVSAGDVIVTSATPRIAHLDIAAGALGALAAVGGVYQMPKTAGSSTAIGADVLVYWDNTNHVITVTSSSNKRLGYTVSVSVDADTTQLVRHSPA